MECFKIYILIVSPVPSKLVYKVHETISYLHIKLNKFVQLSLSNGDKTRETEFRRKIKIKIEKVEKFKSQIITKWMRLGKK